MWDTPNRELSQFAGRWLSPDPAEAGWNQYGYPTNPNSVIDPSGLSAVAPGIVYQNSLLYLSDSYGGSSCIIDGLVEPQSECLNYTQDGAAGSISNCDIFGCNTITQDPDNPDGYVQTVGWYWKEGGTDFEGYDVEGDPYWSPSDPVLTPITDPVDPDMLAWTFQLGVAVNWNFWGPLAGSGFAGIAIDSHGHVAGYYGGGLGMAEGVAISGGVQLGGSNGNSVCALGGPFTNVSGTAGYELAGTGDYFDGAGDAPGGTVRGGRSDLWCWWRWCCISARDSHERPTR